MREKNTQNSHHQVLETFSSREQKKTILKIKAKRSRKMKENNEICYMAYETRMLDQHAIYLIKRKSKTVRVCLI